MADCRGESRAGRTETLGWVTEGQTERGRNWDLMNYSSSARGCCACICMAHTDESPNGKVGVGGRRGGVGKVAPAPVFRRRRGGAPLRKRCAGRAFPLHASTADCLQFSAHPLCLIANFNLRLDPLAAPSQLRLCTSSGFWAVNGIGYIAGRCRDVPVLRYQGSNTPGLRFA